ncbi:MAG: tRNA pseudouridine(55) synthase TruB [Actinomycetia bacterium]|nr:tRNA pseudouridine(55) synthase TruB [Actinomycetes bacterium]
MARRRPSKVHGVVAVDKPAGVTSHDVVSAARRELGERRIGHSGTLDPDATGLLLLGVGRATRLLRFMTVLPKTYTTEIVLGTATSTLDDSGEVTAHFDMSSIEPAQVVESAAKLTGSIMQVPPMVSAVKVDGRRLHELAREGIEVERKARRVEVMSFEVEPTDTPLVYRATVRCGSGTYVRVLAADLGELLGGGAHLRELRRTAMGSFSADDASLLGDLSLLAVEAAVRDHPSVVVDDDEAVRIGHGAALSTAPEGDGPWGVFGLAGNLLAVHERDDRGRVAPGVVLPPAH